MTTPSPPSLRLELPAVPESVTRARHATTQIADVAGIPGDAVALAVSEAVGNAVVHAYDTGADGTVVVSAKLDHDRTLTISVEDDGHGMRPDPDSPGLGLGLSLIGSVASAFRVERVESGGTRVTMRFQAQAA